MSEFTDTLPDHDGEDVSVQTIEEVLANGMQHWMDKTKLDERRTSPRVPLQQKICLIGLDEHHCPDSAACLVDGRDISADGISFRHYGMLSNRFVAMAFHTAKGIETVVVKLSWCLFSREGSYTSGGRFVRANATIEMPQNWELLPKG